MNSLAEKTRLYQAALEEQRRTDVLDFDAREHIEGEVERTRAEMEVAWLEVAHAGR